MAPRARSAVRLDHPDPVEPTFEPISRDQEEAANALADHAAAEADKAARDLTALEARISELAHRLGGTAEANSAPADLLSAALQADAATLAAAARQAKADAERLGNEATRLKAQAAGLSARQRDLDALDDAIARDTIRLTELTDQRAAELDKAEAAAKRADDRRAELSAQLSGAPDLNTALSAARSLAGALTKAADAADETARAQAALLDARRRAAAAAIDGGFERPAGAAVDEALPASDEALAATAMDAARAAMRDATVAPGGRGGRSIAGTRRKPRPSRACWPTPDLDVALSRPAPVAEGTEATVAAAREQYEQAAGRAGPVTGNTARQLDSLAAAARWRAGGPGAADRASGRRTRQPGRPGRRAGREPVQDDAVERSCSRPGWRRSRRRPASGCSP